MELGIEIVMEFRKMDVEIENEVGKVEVDMEVGVEIGIKIEKSGDESGNGN